MDEKKWIPVSEKMSPTINRSLVWSLHRCLTQSLIWEIDDGD